MLRRLAPFTLLLIALAFAACGSSGDDGSTDTSAAADAQTAESAPPADTATAEEPAPEAADAASGCKAVPKPGAKPDGQPEKNGPLLAKGKTYTVTLATNCGTIKIRLDVRRARKTASSFAWLVKQGFYDGLTFHRIVPGFVIQGGDPLGQGTGGPGYKVEEAPPSDLKYTRGVVAMAKTGNEPSGTSGSQFFIVTGDDVGLPPQYALVGKVTGSMAAAGRIEAAPVGGDPSLPEGPSAPIVIEKATLAAK